MIREGFCSKCHKVWMLEAERGVCQWCGKPTSSQATRTLPRSIKSSSRRSPKQALVRSNGYDHLDGEWATYYKVASRFNRKAKAEDTEDLLHDIILTLADAERNNGHKPFTQAVMYRIASRAKDQYWRTYYQANNGLTCGNCSKAQRQTCREKDLYRECSKAIKLESLNKPVLDNEGNLTELGNLIADDKAIDLDAWADAKTFLLTSPGRLLGIAYKRANGIPLTASEDKYLDRFRKKERRQMSLF